MKENNNGVQLVEDENKLVALRREKLQIIREKRQAYPNTFNRKSTAQLLIAKYSEKNRSQLEELAVETMIAGRIIRMRGPFLVITDGGVNIQLYVNKKELSEALANELKLLDLGDIVGVRGVVFKTNKEELTIRLSDFQVLSKSLHPLPDKHKGLIDTELRYRQRYLDLIVNEDSRLIFRKRSKIIRFIRNYFEDLDFMEVETPMMQVIPGGATARPFVTHHNALDQDMYLRVAPELCLKRLVVGGFEKVFELNRNFRNEGLSTRHNPEFTMLEFYQAYANYHDLMDLTEDLLRKIAYALGETTRVTYQGSVYDLGKPFARISVHEAICRHCEISEADLKTITLVKAAAESLGVQFEDEWSSGKIIMEIFEQKVESKLDQPTFVTEYPIEVSPLARRNEERPEITDRFELIIGGRELANGFSELNDPEDQAERFHAQVAQKNSGDQEAMHFDADYVTALEYGLPPTAGEGIGIDRLVMLFADAPSIRDVLLFPHMRPPKNSD